MRRRSFAGRDSAIATTQPSSLEAIERVRSVYSDIESLRRSPRAAGRGLLAALPHLTDTVKGVRSLPSLETAIADTPAGQDVLAAYRGRTRGLSNALAVATLDLPEEPAAYLRGHSRQAVRTNCARAIARGMTYQRPSSLAHASEMITKMTAGRPNGEHERRWMLKRLREQNLLYRFVADECGTPRAHIQYTIESGVARLNWAISDQTERASDARYLVSAELFQELAAGRVRHVLTKSEIFTNPGILYFQRRLGFQPRNLRLRADASVPSAAHVTVRSPEADVPARAPVTSGDGSAVER